MIELLPNIFAIEVPEGTAGISFRQSEFVNSTVSFYDQFTNKETLVELPGNCTHLFTTKGVSEEQAASIVERDRGGFFGNVEGYKEYLNLEIGLWIMNRLSPLSNLCNPC